MSVNDQKPESTSPAQPKEQKKGAIVDERGGVKISSDHFGITLNLVKGGESQDETGRKFSWNDSVKISLGGDKVVKLTAMQAAWLRNAFNVPEVAAELDARVVVERTQLLAEMGGF